MNVLGEVSVVIVGLVALGADGCLSRDACLLDISTWVAVCCNFSAEERMKVRPSSLKILTNRWTWRFLVNIFAIFSREGMGCKID